MGPHDDCMEVLEEIYEMEWQQDTGISLSWALSEASGPLRDTESWAWWSLDLIQQVSPYVFINNIFYNGPILAYCMNKTEW